MSVNYNDMNIKRNAEKALFNWKNTSHHKPLVIRGARQVGKTTLVRNFSKEFEHYVELNLEKEDDRRFFEKTDNVNTIINAIFLSKQIETENMSSVLLFIDEIQEFPKAIQLLRYFYEEFPELYVIAAGSLLEFALKNVKAFPVGRIETLCLHPVNFEEYLNCINKQALNELNHVPVREYAHQPLTDIFHKYAVIGGMPEIVSYYIENKNIYSLNSKYKTLWQSFKSDVEKYADNQTLKNVIRFVIDASPIESDRITFANFGKSNYRSREIGEALRALDKAKIIHLVYPVTTTKPPLIANLKKKPRLQFLDTGMLNNILMLQSDMISIKELNDFYNGKIIQHLVAQEIMSLHNDPDYKPNFWVREKKGSQAEVDLVYQNNQNIIPIEIKSGKKGTLRSLHQFIERADHPYAIRMYGGSFKIEESVTPGGKKYFLMNLPYYLGTKLKEYIDYFTKKY